MTDRSDWLGIWPTSFGDAQGGEPGRIGYAKGVPMDADLMPRTGNGAPRFLVPALKDPLSGNLDCIQIVKEWIDAEGATGEQVLDLVWAGDRVPDANGEIPATGDTADLGQRHLGQHHRRAGTDHGLVGSRF